jgi:leucyl aminopeptidase
MIRVSSAMVKQAPRRNSRLKARSTAATLLPAAASPRIVQSPLAKAAELDALLVMVPESATRSQFEELPDSERWQELHARSKPRAGTVRATALADRRQTAAVVGYLGANAGVFEQLSLAGRMVKEASFRAPQSLGLAALGEAARGLEPLLAAGLACAFRMPAFRSKQSDDHGIRRIDLLDATKVDIPFALAAARGNNLVRWLTALPPNKLDARGYHETIATLARTHKLGFNWLGEDALRRAGANAFLAVSAANLKRDAGIAHLSYRPAGRRSRTPDLSLIGKGILFDTGGVNLKPHRSMLDMHIDMSGSAVALATLLALAELKAPIAADAWLAITENQIGPNAYRPQEVVRASNGVTIQVIHTDAEGRMVLADTLALAARTRPRLMMDFATLTGPIG